MSITITVAVPTPLNKLFHYQSDIPVERGCRLRVPFGRQQLIGISWPQDLPLNENISLKNIEQVIDEQPLWDETRCQWLQWISDYYLHPLGEVLHEALPVKLRQGDPADADPEELWQLTEAGLALVQGGQIRAQRQYQLLQTLAQHGALSWPMLRAFGHQQRSVLDAVADKHWICAHAAIPQPWQQTHQAQSGLRLSAGQATALAAIERQGFACYLLEGVTGSGKTEVYLQLMADVLAAGRSVLYLVPEIGLTPQSIKRISARFHTKIGVVHSGLTDKERLQVWQQARSGELGIVIGTRSALFTPLADLGLIVLDEEHDLSYKQQEGLRYHARDCAIKLAQLLQIPILLGSATPALETLHNALSGKYHHLQLTERAQGAHPEFLWVDMRQQPTGVVLSPPLLQRMHWHLQQQHQVLIFLNRRGYAPALQCHHCGYVVECHHCSALMTLHRHPHHLRCHHCDAVKPLLHHCPNCHQPQLHPTGMGTEQLEHQLKQAFADKRICRIDRDSTSRKGSFEDYVQAINHGEYDILVGTQMLAKGHHFPQVTLVALLDIDGALFASDFRATERLAQLITQVSGRAGRAKAGAQVLLQSHQPEHPQLQDMVNNGYHRFARTLLADRQNQFLPPFSYQALLRISHPNQADAAEALQPLAQQLRAQLTSQQLILGPFPNAMERINNRWYYLLVLQASSRAQLQPLLQQTLHYCQQLPRNLRWSLDRDPQQGL